MNLHGKCHLPVCAITVFRQKNHLFLEFFYLFIYFQIFVSPSPLSDDVLQKPGDENPAKRDFKLVPRNVVSFRFGDKLKSTEKGDSSSVVYF